eukprot:m.34335 g.34335  ORF g.34335 m.34335 type:complete len:532 (-) comp9758_c0_seq1:288-1883(-)
MCCRAGLTMVSATTVVALVVSSLVLCVHSVPCGLEAFTEQLLHDRLQRRATTTPSADTRVAFFDTISPPSCTTQDQVISSFGAGFSECFVPEVTDAYKGATDWPSAVLKSKVYSIRSSSASLVTAGEIDDIMDITNDIFSSADISFNYTTEFVTNNTLYAEMESDPISVATLGAWYTTLQQQFNIPQDLSQRNQHSYIFVVNMDVSSLAGVCFPDFQQLDNRPPTDQTRSSVPSTLGALCIVDYRYFLNSAQHARAAPESLGLTLAHELGHALSLMHTFQATPFYFNGQCRVDGISAPNSCLVTEESSFLNGDFIADTGLIVSKTSEGPSGSSEAQLFDTTTCTPGPFYPTTCSQDKMQVTNTADNYMGYVTDLCKSRFTPQQLGRIRCTIDRFVHGESGRLSNAQTRRLPPVVFGVDVDPDLSNGVLVTWTPPLNYLQSEGDIPTPSTVKYHVVRTHPDENPVTRIFASTVFSYQDSTVTKDPYEYTYQVFAVENGIAGGKLKARLVSSTSYFGPCLATVLASVLLALAL